MGDICPLRKLRRYEWQKSLKFGGRLLDIPVPSTYEYGLDLSALWAGSEQQTNDEKSGHFLSACQTKGGARKRTMNHEPCHCRRCWQLLGTQTHDLNPCSLGTDTISGERRWRTEKGKLQGSGRVHTHGGGRTTCQEENSGVNPLALVAKHVCTRVGFRNSNRTLSVFKDSYERFVCA